MNYEYLFHPRILARGEELVDSGDVVDLQVSGSMIQADVQGTELYEVEIEFRDGEIWNMSCTCPYAEKGLNCKHMAAALIYADDNSNKFDDNMIAQALNKLSKEELVAFLKEQMDKNAKVFEAFQVQYLSTSIESNDMVSEFLQAVSFYGDRDGFINYYRARDFFHELEGLVEKLNVMLDQGYAFKVIKTIASIATDFEEIPLDDSDGGTSCFFDDIEKMIKRVVHSGDRQAVDFAFDWLSQIMESGDNRYLQERVEEVWTSGFSDTEYKEK